MQHVTKIQVDSVYEALRKMRKNVKIFTTDSATMEQAIMDEEVWAALCWNESAWNTGFPMMSPIEGTLTWSCGLVIHKEAPNIDLAYDLIESAISSETSEYLLNEWGYGHSNKKGYETIDAASLAERGLAPDPIAHLNNGNFSNNPSDEITDYIEQQWAEYTAGG
jgi:spermidine/putrescine transport system substrate-binding protein